ncbi:MAG: efflux transporter outer membrane subunit [Pseudomonadota bacterium]|nr:efflux transporter outer membrane subunit [Pseudomonadota bacterium]
MSPVRSARGRAPRLRGALLMAALVLAGCASAPPLPAPELAIPTAYKEAVAAPDGTRWTAAQPAESAARGMWWLAFDDPVLTELIATATAANPNLAAAAARVRQSRALTGVAEADRIPAIGAGAGVQRGRTAPVTLGLPAGTPVAAGTQWQARLSASYEVDLFGRVANNVSAAKADQAASEATYRSVLLALQADVAQTYFRLRESDAEQALLDETVRLRSENVRINQRRFDLGDLGELDLARAKTELATTRADALAVARQRAQLEHALAILTGRPPAAFSAARNPLSEVMVLPNVPAGLPSTLLERRPDVSAAQYAMMASNARIGVARAAMFPALSLTGAGGYASDGLSDLFKWTSRSWLLGALLSLPVIDGGRNQAAIARSQAALDESVASYRQSVLTAFADVEDNLSGLRILAQQADATNDAVVAARRAADLSGKLYRAGSSNYLDSLDAQRNLVAVERNAVQLRGARATATVGLIRALGGAW